MDLAACPVVGLGSVCRRQNSVRIGLIASWLAADSLRLHGFGVKTEGLRLYGEHLASCDSLAWSYDARRNPPLPGHPHRSCANCLPYAAAWRQRLLDVGSRAGQVAAGRRRPAAGTGEPTGTHPAVLSYGMGADSTALLLRWIHEPATRPCDLAGLLVVTAMTGDEWPVTGRLVTEHILPLLRAHDIR